MRRNNLSLPGHPVKRGMHHVSVVQRIRDVASRSVAMSIVQSDVAADARASHRG